MKIRPGPTALALTLALGAAALAQGCVVVTDDDPGPTYLDTYEPCARSSQCLPEDDCFEITVDSGSRVVTDGMCTHGCLDDLDCPYGGACYDLGDGFLCYDRCRDDFDCPPGFGCLDTVGGAPGDAICLPQ